MISFDEAAKLILQVALPLGSETVLLENAQGRILAEPVLAAVSSPSVRKSSMDGYAIRDADFASLPRNLPIIREIFAGENEPGAIGPNECARIFTGAPVPGGADRVVIQEHVSREGGTATFTKPSTEGRNIREAGSDFVSGARLLEAGRELDYRALVSAAAGDCATVECWRQPKVALLATGDELAAPGEARNQPGAIPESVALGVAALVRDNGGIAISLDRLADDVAAAQLASTRALDDADVIVVAGGASVGERDLAKAMFAGHGLELIFAKVAMKPGKPVWFGRARCKLVMGLPGNPTSAMVTARLLLAPLVAGLGGRDPNTACLWRDIPLGASLPANSDRETFVRAKLDNAGRAIPIAHQDSGAQRALVEANLLLRREAFALALSEGGSVSSLDF